MRDACQVTDKKDRTKQTNEIMDHRPPEGTDKK